MTLNQQLEKYLTILQYEDLAQQTSKKECLLHYLRLIEKWNVVHNLTAIRKQGEMISLHIMDSLAILPYIFGPRIADIGTGAGLPGIPIAIAKQEWKIVLIESNNKKAIFLRQVVLELKLKNVEIIPQRVEDFKPEQLFNGVVSRALASLDNFIKLSGHLCKANSCESKMWAMKGSDSSSFYLQDSNPFKIERVITVNVPGLDARRHLLVIKKYKVTQPV